MRQPVKTMFDGTLTGETLSGSTSGQDGPAWAWSDVRAPALEKTAAPQWGRPVQLFNRKDLTGWKMSQPGPPNWTVQNGNLVSPGKGPELVSAFKAQDFKLHIEFNCGKDSTGGALNSQEELPGQIYLQGSEKGHVSFRNIVLTPAR